MFEQREQRLPIMFDVAQNDRLVVAVELRPGAHLGKLFQSAHSAWQHDEAIGALEHRHLALVHGRRDDELIGFGIHPLLCRQELRDDADHPAAMGLYRAGDFAHQPVASPAIDEAYAVFGDHPSELARTFGIGGVSAEARSAEHANIRLKLHKSRPFLGIFKHFGRLRGSLSWSERAERFM
jgi:hypothetical protein